MSLTIYATFGKTYVLRDMASADMPNHPFHFRDHIDRPNGNLGMFSCKHPEYLIRKSLSHHFNPAEIQNYFLEFIQPVADPPGL